jgi:hypothetical protein
MSQLSIELYHTVDYPESSKDEIITVSEVESASCIDRISMEITRLIESYQFMYFSYPEDIKNLVDQYIRSLNRTVNFILQ